MTQREAVAMAVRAVIPHGKVTNEGLTKAQKDEIHAIVLKLMESGEVDLKGENKDGSARDKAWMLKYIPGLVNNWIRKDPDLNGGAKYVPKNPGSRTGTGDATLVSLKALLQMLPAGDENRGAVELAIKERTEELKPKAVVIDASKLPEHLRHLVARA